MSVKAQSHTSGESTTASRMCWRAITAKLWLVADASDASVRVALTSSAFGGSITCNASGTCTYTPPPVLILGFDTFTYSVTDSSGLSDPGTVTIDYR